MPTSKDFTYTRVLFTMFRNVMNYRNLRVMHVSVIYRHESHLCIILIHYTAHVFARKQCILCYALRGKSYPILPYVTSLRVSFSISALELPRTALLCCRLAASRLREAARWQSSRSTTARKLGRWLYLCQDKYKLCCSKWIYLPTFFEVKRSLELTYYLPA